MPRPHVVLEGDFRVPTSLALINRELGRRLAVHPAFDFTAVEHALPDLRVEIAPELTGCMVAPDQLAGTPDVRIWHRWPPALQRLPARRFILMQPWEFGELPIAWRDAALDEVDQIWAYSGYVKGIYERAGIPPEKVVVVPLGVDPERFTPQGPKLDLPARGLRALFVGGSIRRKGIDVAVNAFLTAFSASDDVTLVIKDFAQLYPTNNLGAQVAEIAARDGVAHILYYDGMLTDADVAALYRSCDVFLAPYRGEGFGLPVLEAMACGLPVIVTAGGATDDFVDDAVGFRIAASRSYYPPGQGPSEMVASGWLLEPNGGDVVTALRRCFEDRGLRERLGSAAAARARTWTWDRTGAIACEAIATASR